MISYRYTSPDVALLNFYTANDWSVTLLRDTGVFTCLHNIYIYVYIYVYIYIYYVSIYIYIIYIQLVSLGLMSGVTSFGGGVYLLLCIDCAV